MSAIVTPLSYYVSKMVKENFTVLPLTGFAVMHTDKGFVLLDAITGRTIHGVGSYVDGDIYVNQIKSAKSEIESNVYIPYEGYGYVTKDEIICNAESIDLNVFVNDKLYDLPKDNVDFLYKSFGDYCKLKFRNGRVVYNPVGKVMLDRKAIISPTIAESAIFDAIYNTDISKFRTLNDLIRLWNNVGSRFALNESGDQVNTDYIVSDSPVLALVKVRVRLSTTQSSTNRVNLFGVEFTDLGNGRYGLCETTLNHPHCLHLDGTAYIVVKTIFGPHTNRVNPNYIDVYGREYKFPWAIEDLSEAQLGSPLADPNVVFGAFNDDYSLFSDIQSITIDPTANFKQSVLKTAKATTSDSCVINYSNLSELLPFTAHRDVQIPRLFDLYSEAPSVQVDGYREPQPAKQCKIVQAGTVVRNCTVPMIVVAESYESVRHVKAIAVALKCPKAN